MDTGLLISTLTMPTLLFFVLGMVASLVKSDLEIPASTSRFISLYLLFSIGFKGGQELAHEGINSTTLACLGFGLLLSSVVPVYTFFLGKRKLGVSNAAAVAASYGSVSAVTFVAATSFLEHFSQHPGGHMVAVMAFMEAPAIIVGMLLLRKYSDSSEKGTSIKHQLHHALTNSSVLMVLGSLIIGLIANTKEAEGIKPFTTDIFKGFLAIFLLEMGMVTVKRLSAFKQYGAFAALMAIGIPIFNGLITAYLSGLVTQALPDRLMFCILAASASYIAVPAAMRLAAPEADPGLYIPMALGITFPFNISLGLPIYWWAIQQM